MKKLIMIAIFISIFTVFAGVNDGTISGTIFDTTMPVQYLISLNDAGAKNGKLVSIKIEVLGDTSQTLNYEDRKKQVYAVENNDGIIVSSRTISSAVSTTSHKITKIVITRRQ